MYINLVVTTGNSEQKLEQKSSNKFAQNKMKFSENFTNSFNIIYFVKCVNEMWFSYDNLDLFGYFKYLEYFGTPGQFQYFYLPVNKKFSWKNFNKPSLHNCNYS